MFTDEIEAKEWLEAIFIRFAKLKNFNIRLIWNKNILQWYL
jgi:hypothetical protein